MKQRHCLYFFLNFAAAFIAAGVFLFSFKSYAFEVPSKRTTYLHRRGLTFNIGLGTADLIRNSGGIDGDPGVGFRVGISHPLTDIFAVDLQYQLTAIWLHSPDPVVKGGSRVDTTFWFNQGYTRLLAFWPYKWWQPYVFAGVGIYSFVGVDGRTGLSFPANLEIPFGTGIRFFLSGDRVALKTEFMYHFLFGEGQDASVLALLGVPSMNFDVYSATVDIEFTFW